jgi:hypothetical protein
MIRGSLPASPEKAYPRSINKLYLSYILITIECGDSSLHDGVVLSDLLLLLLLSLEVPDLNDSVNAALSTVQTDVHHDQDHRHESKVLMQVQVLELPVEHIAGNQGDHPEQYNVREYAQEHKHKHEYYHTVLYIVISLPL